MPARPPPDVEEKMKKVVGWLVAAELCLVLAAPAGTVARRQEAAKNQKPLEYQVAVTLKLIQAYVTDRKGKPVEDLTKDDFVVYEDGRPMAITEFERHVLSPPPAEAGPANTLREPAPEVSSAGRKFVFFFDFAYNNQRGVVKAREAALHFIDTELGPDDAAAVISYSMLGGLAIHEFFTADRAKVREAVAAINGKRITGRAEDIEEMFWRQATESPPERGPGVPELNPTTPPKTPPTFNWRRQESKDMAENYILKLTSLAKALRYVPGQKNFVFFSTGIVASLVYGNQEGNPGETPQVYGLKQVRAQFDVGDYHVKTAHEQMLKEMSAANCAMFTFDTREAALVPSLFTYDEQTYEEGGQYRDIFYDEGVHQQVTDPLKEDRITGLYSLRRLSVVTGGKYFSNIIDYKRTLDELQTLTGAFYILGYAIPRAADGRYHSLKVEVKRKGCRVKSQTGYFNPRPFAEFSDLEKQLHLFDLALSDRPVLQAPQPFPVSALSFAAGSEGRLELVGKLPASLINRFEGRKVEIISFVFDAQDNVAGLQRRVADLSRYKGADIIVLFGAPLAPGTYKCRIVVRDLVTGDSARASVPIFVKNKPPAGLDLASPLLLLPRGHFSYIESEAARKAPFALSDVYPYQRALYSPLVGDVPAGTSTIYALLPATAVGLVQPAISIAGSLIEAASGKKTPLHSATLVRTTRGNLEIEFLEISLEGIPPGRYLLYLYAEDSISKSVAFTRTELVISP